MRLRILSMLATAAGSAICDYDLVEPIGSTQPTVSHHLKALKETGPVTAQRDRITATSAGIPLDTPTQGERRNG